MAKGHDGGLTSLADIVLQLGKLQRNDVDSGLRWLGIMDVLVKGMMRGEDKVRNSALEIVLRLFAEAREILTAKD